MDNNDFKVGGQEGSDGEEGDLAVVEVDDVEDLYRSSKVKCGV